MKDITGVVTDVEAQRLIRNKIEDVKAWPIEGTSFLPDRSGES